MDRLKLIETYVAVSRTSNSAFPKSGLKVRGYIEVRNCQTVANIVKAGIGK